MKQSSLSQKVYGKLLSRIMNGSWRPGSVVDRRSIAKELGVSIAPVGEAMTRLQSEGFIVNLPRKGTLLRASDPRRLYESLILREALERHALFIAFPFPGSRDMSKLEKLALAADSPLARERVVAEEAFHKELVRLAGVEALSEQFDRICLQVVFDELQAVELSNAVRDSHVEMLQSLRAAKSPEEAAACASVHLRFGRESFYARFENKEA